MRWTISSPDNVWKRSQVWLPDSQTQIIGLMVIKKPNTMLGFSITQSLNFPITNHSGALDWERTQAYILHVGFLELLLLRSQIDDDRDCGARRGCHHQALGRGGSENSKFDINSSFEGMVASDFDLLDRDHACFNDASLEVNSGYPWRPW